MSGECRATTAQTIDVQLVGATITVRATGVALQAGEAARITLTQEGATVRCELQACSMDVPVLDQPHVVEALFALPFAPRTVVVTHALGEETFHFDVAIVEPRTLPPLRDASPAEDVMHAPVTLPDAAPQIDIDWTDAGHVGMGGADDFRVPSPSAPSPGRIDLPPPAPPPGGGGGILGNWVDRLRGRWITRAEPTMAEPTMAEPTAAEPPPMAAPEMTAGDEPVAANGGGSSDEPVTVDGGGPGVIVAGNGGSDHGPSETGGYFPRLDAPDFAVVGTPVEVTVGIRATEDPAVGGGVMTPPPTVGPTYVLSVQLMADGFSLAGGGASWVADLAVTPNQPYPAIGFKIVADPIQGRAKPAVLQVVYTVEGQVIGNAKRALAVVTEVAAANEVDLPDVAVSRAMALPVGATPADLTVVILTDESGPPGRLLWAFRTPHPVATPEVDCITNVGSTPADFAEALRRDAEKAEGKATLLETMRGIGRTIADVIHPELWRIFKEVSDAAGGKPTVLILSEEPFVPWELAVLRKPTFPDDSRFLAAEAVTGRWLLDEGPRMPPPELVEMKTMAVVYGEYTTARLRKLVEAKAEMEKLQADYAATPVRATLPAVKGMLDGAPDAQVLHFAIHGKFNSRGADLLMEDGEELTAFAIRGSQLDNAPFVFLNACQVGAANELLGSYAGMAQAFLRAGASAVVAPLWSVRDDIAKEISLRFYPGAFGGLPPAEILRQERASFGSGGPPTSATYLAYQFYGHPAFRLTK